MLAGCTGRPDVSVRVPDGPAAGCGRVHDALPGSLDGRDRDATRPSSTRTAAWGDPPVVLRCGVGRPAGLTATSQVVEVNGVEWFLTEPAPPYVFTTVGRGTYLQVRVPSSVPRSEATAPLVDLAEAVRTALPEHTP
ncbi:MAG: hypothetical protein QOD68_2444 [Actinomycetota bacterium]|nr:hypothetical protein [Actinomycetota bacterium]